MWGTPVVPVKDRRAVRFIPTHVGNTLMNPPAGQYYRSLDASIMELADDICYSVHDLEDAISLNLISKEKFWTVLEQSGGTQDFLKETDEQLQKKFQNCESIMTTFENLFSDMPHIRKGSIGRLIHLCIIHCKLRYDSGFSSPLLSECLSRTSFC